MICVFVFFIFVCCAYFKTKRDLDDANTVSNLQSFVVRCETHVSFFLTVGTDQCVYLRQVNFVQFLDGGSDVALVGTDVDDECECVVVFDLLHGRLCAQGVLDDCVFVHLVARSKALALIPTQKERTPLVDGHHDTSISCFVSTIVRK